MKAELLDPRLPSCALGEGPVWDAEAQALYWVDIQGKTIHRYDVSTGEHKTRATPTTVGFAALDDGGQIIAGLQDGISRIHFGNGSLQTIVKPQYAHPDNRFNDGKCDSRGRLWAGTMNDKDHAKPTGALYRLDERGLGEQATGIYVSNGLGWSPDDKTMYYTDTGTRKVWVYDYDIETGEASGRRDFLSFEDKSKGKPDGMCVDSQGRVYNALWDGWGISIHAPDGKSEGRIDLPVPRVTCCAFGGDDMKTLYITTASTGLSDAQKKEAPLAGCVFAVRMDIAGQPVARYHG